MKYIRLAGLVFVGAMLLSVVLAIAALFYIQSADHRALTQDLIYKNSGWRTQFDSVDLSIFPRLNFVATGIKVLPHQGEDNVLTADKISVNAPLLPLIFNQEVDYISVINPSVKLIRTAEGKANWEPVRKSRRSSGKAGAPDPGLLMRLHTVLVTNGSFVMRDIPAQQNINLTGFNVSLANETDAVKRGEIQGVLNGMPLDMLTRLRLEDGDAAAIPTEIRLSLENNLVNFEGTLIDAFAKNPGLAGDLEINAPSALALINRLKLAEVPAELQSAPVGLTAQISASQAATTLQDARLTIGGNVLLGDVSVRDQSGGMIVDVAVTGQRLNFSAYPFCAAQQENTTGKPATTPWSDQLIDLSFLHKHTISVAFNFANITCQGKTYERVKLDTRIDNKQLALNELRVDFKPESFVRVSGNMGLESPMLGRFETALNGFDPSWMNAGLQGKFEVPLTGSITTSFRGASSADWAASLNGAVDIKATTGKVLGFNPQGFVDTLKRFSGGGAVSGEQQSLQLLDVKYKIEQGVARVETLKVKTGKLEITGEGKIDVANWTINHKLTPTGSAVSIPPVLIRGSLNKPTIVPELTSVEAVSTGVGALVGGPVGAALGNVIGGKLKDAGLAGSSSPTTTTNGEEEQVLPFDLMDKENLKQNLRGFLGGGE